MVRCISTFLDACYIARRNAITSKSLQRFKSLVERFHELRNIFITTGVRKSISLPRQHAFPHFFYKIQLFASPNGTCTSLTESKHIKVVKEPWRRSNRFRALVQMLRIIIRMEKMAAQKRLLTRAGLLSGRTAEAYAPQSDEQSSSDELDCDDGEEDDESDDEMPLAGTQASFGESLSLVRLASRIRECAIYLEVWHNTKSHNSILEPKYPRRLEQLAAYIQEPAFLLAFHHFLYFCDYPDADLDFPPPLEDCPEFKGKIQVYHSAIASYYAPSDLCGAGGMRQERIRSSPQFNGTARRDTVLVTLHESQPGMKGMLVARVNLFFSFQYRHTDFQCALVNWYVHTDDKPDEDTGMWIMEVERSRDGQPTWQVIDIKSIARGVHMLPVYGDQRLPENFEYAKSLDSFDRFFVNHFIDHHAHELLVI